MQQTEARTGRASATQLITLGFETILAGYAHARAHDALDASHTLWRTAKQVQTAMMSLDAVERRPDLQVRWSFGQGAWARIPWFALLDRRETKATSSGVYVIHLFREDMSGVYLTLNQGVTKEKEKRGAEAGREFVRRRAQELSPLCGELEADGFELGSDIDLRTTNPLGRDYQLATVVHKLYERERVPKHAVICRDIERLLDVYDAYLQGQHNQQRRAR